MTQVAGPSAAVASDSARRLLVLEDHESLGNSLVTGLVSNGYETVLTKTVTDARVLLRDSRFDLVLLDLDMPDTDGFAFVSEISNDQPDLPVVIVTTRGSDVDVVAGLDSGAIDVVVKPFAFGVLLARVRAHLCDARPITGI